MLPVVLGLRSGADRMRLVISEPSPVLGIELRRLGSAGGTRRAQFLTAFGLS